MNNDLDLIVKQYPEDIPALHVYAIGDVHVGSPQFDEQAIKKKIKIIQEDPCAAVCFCGDAADLGLRNSKTNIYLATLSVREQLEYTFELFKPITHKFAAVVPGNHEERITREVGTCPMYDLCVRWGIPEVYRENVAITKFMFSMTPGNHKRRLTFIGITTHGSTRNKHIPYKEIVVDAHLQPGGYSIKKEYEISPPPELQYIELSAYRDGRGATRKLHKVMNYHAIQL